MRTDEREKLEALILRIDQTAGQAWLISMGLATVVDGGSPVDAVAGLGETLSSIAASLDQIASANEEGGE